MSSNNKRIVDLINALTDEEKPAISLEYFPPRSADGVAVRWRLACGVWRVTFGVSVAAVSFGVGVNVDVIIDSNEALLCSCVRCVLLPLSRGRRG